MSKVIRMRIKKIRRERKWGRSCFFGSPDLPLKMLEECDDDEVFVAQINLDEVRKIYNSSLLPNHGLLYFFVGLNDYRAIVRYYEKYKYNEKENGRIDFNDMVNSEEDFTSEYKIKFDHRHVDGAVFLLGEEHYSNEMLPGEIVLMQYNQSFGAKLLKTDGVIQFVIDKEELLKRNFSAARLLIVRDENTLL